MKIFWPRFRQGHIQWRQAGCFLVGEFSWTTAARDNCFCWTKLIICNYIQKKKWWRTFASYDFCEDFLLFVENESGSLKQEFYTKYFTNSCNRNMVQHAKFGDQFSFQFTPWTLCLSKTKQLLNKISKERGINNKNMDSQRIQPRRDWCKDCFSQFKSQ